MPEASAAKNWDSLAAAGLGAAFLTLYALTLCHTVYWYDSAELTTAAVTLGVTHPPGYPLYTLLGHVFTWLPVEPATAVNLMSAVFAALAVAFVFLIGRQLGLARAAASLGAASLGAGELFWANAVVAEVYCPAVAVSALVLYLLLRALHEGRFRLALWAAFTAGLGLGLHMSVATLGLGFAYLVWVNGKRLTRMLQAGGAALLGSLVFIYVPVRASQHPPLNICDPSTLEQLAWYLGGGAYRDWFSQRDGALERLWTIGGFFHAQLGWAALGLAVLGAIWLARKRPAACVALVLMAFGNVLFFFNYEAHDLEVFMLQTTMVLCCFVGAGAQALVDGIANRLPAAKSQQAGALVSALLMLIPLRLVYANYGAVDMSDFHETAPFIEAAIEALPPDAVILNFSTPPEWKRYAVFGMYAQLVDGKRPDVKHLFSPDLRKLAHELSPDVSIFVYAPVEMLAYFFELEPAGPLHRVVAAKPNAATEAPRKRTKRKRSCWN
jgi:hypothetical protein